MVDKVAPASPVRKKKKKSKKFLSKKTPLNSFGDTDINIDKWADRTDRDIAILLVEQRKLRRDVGQCFARIDQIINAYRSLKGHMDALHKGSAK